MCKNETFTIDVFDTYTYIHTTHTTHNTLWIRIIINNGCH